MAKKRDTVYVVFWTWRKHRILRRKSDYSHMKKAWKWWYERHGWTVRGEFAYKGEQRHAIGFREVPVDDIERITLPGEQRELRPRLREAV